MSQRLLNAVALTVMVCSVTATGIYVRASYHGSAAINRALPMVTHVPNWRQYAQHGHWMGVSHPQVTVVEFADYQCPACRAFHPSLVQLVGRHPGLVSVVFRNYPLSEIHPRARIAAMAAECADVQRRFEPMQSVLYDDADSVGRIPWGRLAARAGVRDTSRFVRCVSDSAVKSTVDADVLAGDQLDLHGTPSFLINDSLYFNVGTARILERLVLNAARMHD